MPGSKDKTEKLEGQLVTLLPDWLVEKITDNEDKLTFRQGLLLLTIYRNSWHTATGMAETRWALPMAKLKRLGLIESIARRPKLTPEGEAAAVVYLEMLRAVLKHGY